jgi:hypothetical protein
MHAKSNNTKHGKAHASQTEESIERKTKRTQMPKRVAVVAVSAGCATACETSPFELRLTQNSLRGQRKARAKGGKRSV